MAVQEAGVDVRVVVLHRVIPPLSAFRGHDVRAFVSPLLQPLWRTLDGLSVWYVPFVSPLRAYSYGNWGRWASPSLATALSILRRKFPFDLIHAHYAAPAGDAARRLKVSAPLIVSAHGGDVLAVADDGGAGAAAVASTLREARLVLANSRGIEQRCRALGAKQTRVVHLGADIPAVVPSSARELSEPVLVTVANLVSRKRHIDILEAIRVLAPEFPALRWRLIGDGPERPMLERLAAQFGLTERLEFRGALGHQEALEEMRKGSIFVLPSVDEAFGVAYVEAMAAGLPVVGCQGEPGPEEIASCGPGIVLVQRRDPRALAAAIRRLLSDEQLRSRLGAQAAITAARHFSWQHCGQETVRAYADAMRPAPG
jgi:teichuronic acid biosynthesis glycosyltransferase TuaC